MHIKNVRTLVSVSIFVTGLIITVIAIQFPAVRQYIGRIDQSGLMGAFFAGVLYALAFTSSMATVVFLNMPASISSLLVALIGGLGAAVYDVTVFVILRTQSRQGLLEALRSRLSDSKKLPSWLLTLSGLAILASPLPDELASGLLSFTKISAKKFIIISFLANVIGIYIISSVGRL
ncbi:MAG: hypothetical protein WC497_03015 [Patescibacteria group bacterium]